MERMTVSGLDTEGLYRLAGFHDDVEAIRMSFDKGRWSVSSCNICACLSLPVCLCLSVSLFFFLSLCVCLSLCLSCSNITLTYVLYHSSLKVGGQSTSLGGCLVVSSMKGFRNYLTVAVAESITLESVHLGQFMVFVNKGKPFSLSIILDYFIFFNAAFLNYVFTFFSK